MKVCLVCEGSYPYVSGGVAGWVHMLCSEFPETEFVIWSIATTPEDMHEYKYELPSNVTSVQTVYIGETYQHPKMKKIRLSSEDKAVLEMLILASAKEIDWEKVIGFIEKYRRVLPQIIMGEDFFRCCLKIYEEQEMVVAFHDFLWNMRDMYLPLMIALSGELPQADLYHAVSTGYAGILASCASHVHKKPLIISEHGIYTREREEDIIWSDWVSGEYKDIWISFFNKLSAIAYNRADLVTCLFETNRTIQEELGCPSDRIRVIPNGIDYQRFYRPVPDAPRKKDTFDIGSVLRIVPIKDVKTMLVAFYQIKTVIKNARLHLLGNFDENPSYYEECLELKENLGLEDVTFYGQVNVSEYIDLFDVILLTSISEGQPLSVLEGMAAGKPFVCTNVGDCRGLIYGENDEFGPAGFIVPVMNSEEIAGSVIRLWQEPELLTVMGRSGQQRVERYYQKEQFLNIFREIYKELGGEK